MFVPRKYLYQKETTGRREKKCFPLVGAITPVTCAGRQNTPSRERLYRDLNGKLSTLIQTYHHGTVSAPRKYLYQKEATGMQRPEMYSTSRCNNSTSLCGPSKYPILREAVWAQNGKLPELGQTYRHSTVFPPRKYLYQKEATGMERPEMSSTSRCNNPTYLCRLSNYPISREAVLAQNGKFTKLGRTYCHGIVFAPRKYLNQKEATGMERPEMHSTSQCINPTYLYGPSKYPISREAVWAQNGKLPKLGRNYRHGTVFAPRKYLYQKETTGMQKPEMYSTSRCNNSTYLCGPSNYPISREAVWAQNGKLPKLGQTYRHGTVFAPRKYLYQKEATGMERPEISSTSRCNNPTYLCGP